MVSFFFDGWEPIARILVVGTLGYIALVLLLRVGGKRTMSQMNAFDFVITVALGASFGRTLTATEVSLLEAVVTFSLLVLLQYLFAQVEMRSHRFSKVVTAEPRLLYFRGEIRHDAMRRERIKESELRGAVRKSGKSSLDEVAAVILESDGKYSVIDLDSLHDRAELNGVDGA